MRERPVAARQYIQTNDNLAIPRPGFWSVTEGKQPVDGYSRRAYKVWYDEILPLKGWRPKSRGKCNRHRWVVTDRNGFVRLLGALQAIKPGVFPEGWHRRLRQQTKRGLHPIPVVCLACCPRDQAICQRLGGYAVSASNRTRHDGIAGPGPRVPHTRKRGLLACFRSIPMDPPGPVFTTCTWAYGP